MSLPAGSRVGPYEVLGSIGAGGMGEVYRAHDPRLGRDVAIKVLPDAVGIGGERGRQDLDRNVATEPRVVRAVDLAHAAGAERRDDVVRAEPVTGGETHGCS